MATPTTAAAATTVSANLSRHYSRILKQWPRDMLRPTSAFTSVIEKRIEHCNTTPNMSDAQQRIEMRRINALYSLLDDRYAKKWPIRADLLKPEANPNHYYDLMKDIDEAPTRTQAESWLKNVSGKIRLK